MCKSVDITMFMHVSNCLQTQKMCDKAVEKKSNMFTLNCMKKLLKIVFAVIDVPNQHKTQQMRETVIQKNPGMPQFVPNLCKTQRRCKKAVYYCPHALEYVPKCYMTQEIC